MKRDRVAEIHFYEWRIGAWSISETRDRLDAAGRGIYRELLDQCYGAGKFPSDIEWICRRCACTPEQYEKTWKIISRHFPLIEKTEYRYNVHADIIRAEYFLYVEKQRSNRKCRESKRNKSNEVRYGGSTVSENVSNGGSTNGNGNDNGNTTATASIPKSTAVDPTAEALLRIAGEIHSRHTRRRDLSVDAVAKKLAIIMKFKKYPKAKWEEESQKINVNHRAACQSWDWTKEGGKFMKGLSSWLLASEGRYEEEAQPSPSLFHEEPRLMFK